MAENTKLGYTPKEDSPSTLVHGTGTPYLAIFNGAGNPILCQKNNLPIGTFVKSFEYVYKEDEEDVGEIRLETDNPNILDHEDLQYYSELLLQWGYIFSDQSFLCGPPRKVIIIGMSSEFTEHGTTVNFKVADAGILLKTVPANYYNNLEGFEDYIKDLLEGDIIGEVKLVDYSNVESQVIPMVAQRVITNDEVVYTMSHSDKVPTSFVGPYNSSYPIVYELPQVPNQSIPNQVGVTLLNYNADTKQLVENFPDNYRKIWVRAKECHTLMVTGIPKNKYQQIKEWTKTLDNGPWSMDFRDGKLTIHNRAIGRSLYKVYTYNGGNGELLQFKVDSEFVHSSVEVSKSVSIDPNDKSIQTQVVQGINNPLVGNIDGYMAWQQGYLWNRNWTGFSDSNSKIDNLSGPDNRPLNPDGSPMTMLQRGQPYFYQDTTGTKVTGPLEFESVAEAKRKIKNNWTSYVTQSDIDQWFSNFKSDFDSWLKSDNIDKTLHDLQNIPNYVIKMKVKITRQEIPDMIAAGIWMLQSGKTTDELKNIITSGDFNWDDINRQSLGFDGPGKYLTTGAWVGGNFYKKSQAIQKVQEVISSIGGIVSYQEEVVDDKQTIKGVESTKKARRIKGTATLEMEVAIPIAGVRLLGDPRIVGSVAAMGSDIEETITNQMKATGTVIGDPLLESSFNIQIQNVSNKYSGVWYTKQVTHRLSTESGYLCDIEFVQRAVPVSRRVIKSSWVHSDFGKNIHEQAKKALDVAAKNEVTPESGPWQGSSKVLQEVITKFQDFGQSQAVFANDEGISVLAKEDKERFDKFMGARGVNDYKSPPTNYVEALPE